MSIVTTVLAGAASFGVTDLATVMDELSITSGSTANDAWLSRAIIQVSKAMMQETNRVFAPEYLQDIIDTKRMRSQVPNGLTEVQLSRFPVIMVASVVQLSSSAGISTTLAEGTDFRVDYESGTLRRLNSSTGSEMAWEALPLAVKYVAGFGAMATEQHTVPATSTYTVVVSQAAAFSCDQAVTYASGAALTRVAANPAAGQYTLAGATGTYTFAAGDASKPLTFSYAVRDMPDDLEQACLEIVTGRFRDRGRNPALISREQPGVGVERFWFGGTPGQRGAFAPAIQAMLDNYSVPVAV